MDGVNGMGRQPLPSILCSNNNKVEKIRQRQEGDKRPSRAVQARGQSGRAIGVGHSPSQMGPLAEEEEEGEEEANAAMLATALARAKPTAARLLSAVGNGGQRQPSRNGGALSSIHNQQSSSK